MSQLLDSKFNDYYWNPSKVPKDKRLRLMPAGEQAKMHLADMASHRGLVYSTKVKEKDNG